MTKILGFQSKKDSGTHHQTSDMTSEGFGDMFEGDSVKTKITFFSSEIADLQKNFQILPGFW